MDPFKAAALKEVKRREDLQIVLGIVSNEEVSGVPQKENDKYLDPTEMDLRLGWMRMRELLGENHLTTDLINFFYDDDYPTTPEDIQQFKDDLLKWLIKRFDIIFDCYVGIEKDKFRRKTIRKKGAEKAALTRALKKQKAIGLYKGLG